MRLALLAGLVAASFAPLACGEAPADAGSPEPIEHVHGLGVDPADGALFIAAHNGLFRSPEGSTAAERVGEGSQDTMGFTVIGPNRFLSSGHPGPDEEGPPALGLIRSNDGGLSWQEVSLGGEADLHVLRYVADRIYAVDALSGLLMVSTDQGATWTTHRPPAPVIDLTADPNDPERVVISIERGLAGSDDGGATWKPVPGDIGLVTWAASKDLYLVDAAGQVQLSEDGGSRWTKRGSIGGQPVAFVAAADGTLYAALGDGTVVSSTDRANSWNVRSSQ